MTETDHRIKTKFDIGLKEVVKNFKLIMSFTLIRRLKLLFVFYLKITILLLKKEKLLKIC